MTELRIYIDDGQVFTMEVKDADVANELAQRIAHSGYISTDTDGDSTIYPGRRIAKVLIHPHPEQK